MGANLFLRILFTASTGPGATRWQGIRWQGTFLAEAAGGVADEAEVVVGREAFVGKERRGADGGIVGALEDGGAFIDFVEHGLVDHSGAGVLGFDVLFPEEAALLSRDHIQFGFGFHIVPTETGEDDRQVFLAVFFAPVDIGSPAVAGVVSDAVEGAIAAHGPGADDVRFTNHVV